MQPSEIKIGQRYRWTGWEGFATAEIPDRQLHTEEELRGETAEVFDTLTSVEGNFFVGITVLGIMYYVSPVTLSPLKEGEDDER